MESANENIPLNPPFPMPPVFPNLSGPFGIVIDMNRSAAEPIVPPPPVPDPADLPGPSVPRGDQMVEVQTSSTSPVHLLCLDCPEHGSGVEHSMLRDFVCFGTFRVRGTLYGVLFMDIGIQL
jgi:hypothetical protein